MSVRTASVLVIILAIVTARGAASQSAAAAEMPALRHADAEGLARLPFIVAQQKDFFAQAGVRVNVIKDAIAGPYSNSQAALKGYEPSIERGGRADMATANGGFFINAVLNGSDAVAVGVQTANPVYSLIARPEIRTYADLKGKTITLTAPWDGITLTTRALLAQHGIGKNDFTFEAIRMSDTRLECLKAGKCAAIAAVHPTDIQAINSGLGFHRLGTTVEAGPVTFYVEVVRREWASTHQDAIVRYLRAQAAAMRFIHDPKNRGEVSRIIKEITGEPQAIVDQLVANYADDSTHD